MFSESDLKESSSEFLKLGRSHLLNSGCADNFVWVFLMSSYLVLARKYRPQNFDELVGQEVLVTTCIMLIF